MVRKNTLHIQSSGILVTQQKGNQMMKWRICSDPCKAMHDGHLQNVFTYDIPYSVSCFYQKPMKTEYIDMPEMVMSSLQSDPQNYADWLENLVGD